MSSLEPNVTQLRKGTLELCILAILGRREDYGYQIVKQLNQAGEWEISEGTVYPLLLRLKKEGLVLSQWKEPVSGQARKYYRLSETGKTTLEQQGREWVRLRNNVDRILSDGEKA